MYYPVLTSQEMKRIEQLAIQDGCSEEAFMLVAGQKVGIAALEFLENVPKKVVLLIGKGNKGGDAFVAGLYLLEKGVQVHAVTLFAANTCSPLNQKFRERFLKKGGSCLSDFFFGDASLIIDGLFGTGFQGIIDGKIAELIQLANNSALPMISIDIPSGLDGTTGDVRGEAIKADMTVALGCYKSGFFLNSGWNHVGNIRFEEFGLPQKYLDQAELVARIPRTISLPPIIRNRHKYQAGYVVGFSGSKVLKGAPKLAGLSALRSGAGIVRIFHLEEIGETPFSLICQKWNLPSWKKECQRAGSLFLGPGIGKSAKILQFLKKEVKKILWPIVVDADAIQSNIQYPKNALVTPHHGEAMRLFGVKKERELFAYAQKWVDRTECILVLKGAPTWIYSAKTAPIIIPFGDPGMAKAGTGDVLTGILSALLAQKMDPLQAAIVGCSLHAIAGEIAAQDKTSYSMMAEDIINNIPLAIQIIDRGI
ncbi:MAG TPA: NAD(P)H-hydrate dehydratase [Chlamydiales bacterium]|nr:NAD(P)H-hydrate dehydratase [Chlamydiales bacterium]